MKLDKFRVIFAAGGSGGHLFPAQIAAEQLQKSGRVDIMFVGGGIGRSKFFSQTKFSFQETACASLSKNPFKLVFNSFKIAKGCLQANFIINSFRPHLVVGFGSYHTAPFLLATRFRKIPYVLHEANAYPGRIIRHFTPSAQWTGLNFGEAKASLRGTTKIVGMPQKMSQNRSRKEALDYFKLQENLFTVLIFGGSQGAVAINRSVMEMIAHCKGSKLQFIHLTGNKNISDILKKEYHKYNLNAYVDEFEEEMELAWQLADLFIGRAGASSLTEARRHRVPAVLIPYPHAIDDHQFINANCYLNLGEASIIEQSNLNANYLFETIQKYMAVSNKLKGAFTPAHDSLSHEILTTLNILYAGD